MNAISSIWRRVRRAAGVLREDRRGIAAVEFAMVAPVMLVLFFGTVEFSSGVAVDRKVTLMARTLSDLTSQSISISDADLTNFFAASKAILTPYPTTPATSRITELYVDATVGAKVIWSKGTAPYPAGQTLTVPTALKVNGTYLIFSEVTYAYTPVTTYLLKTSISLSDVAYTRPRQSFCVIYPTPAAGVALPGCPTS